MDITAQKPATRELLAALALPASMAAASVPIPLRLSSAKKAGLADARILPGIGQP